MRNARQSRIFAQLWLRDSLHALVVSLVVSGTAGCLKKSSASSSPVASLPSSLTISGTVMTAAAAPDPGALVYVGANQAPSATAAADGTFSFTLDSSTITALTGASTNNAIYVYCADANDATQQAVSAPISLGELGTKALGTIILQTAASVQGTLLQIATGKQQTTPAVGIVVSAGRASATTASDGSFTIKGIAPGVVPLTATAPGSSPAQQQVTLTAGQNLGLPLPMVLFPLSGIGGLVVPDTSVSIADFVAQGHPFMRSFDPIAGTGAQFIRYSNDPTQVTASGVGGAAWQTIGASFDYNFQKDGGSTLYYQFADTAQKTFSGVLSIAVVLDQFAATTNLTLGDGSGQLTSNIVPVTVTVPPAAYRMRVGISNSDVTSAPWQEPQATFNYTFILSRDPTTNLIQGFGNLTLYLEFEDANGLVSPLYTASATLNLFPPATASQIFTVNNGATTTATRLVQLTINVPPNAWEMLVYEADTTSNVNVLFPAPTNGTTPNTRTIWLAAAPTAYYTFSSVGSKTLFLQFRTIDQAVSPIYNYPIAVQPFANPALGGFTMNGGAPTALSPYFVINLLTPPEAMAFRIFESSDITVTNGANNTTNVTNSFSADISTTTPWLTPTPTFIYTAHEAIGVTTVYVQFQNADNDLSQVYQQTTNIQPEPPGSGSVIINPDPTTGQTAQATTNPVVNLRITPPPGYVNGAMAIYEGTVAAALLNFIQVPQPDPTTGQLPTVPYTVSGVGAHTIYVQFETTDQAGVITESPAALSQTIFYQPFPAGLSSVAINGGAATVSLATANNVVLTLTAPNNVTQMRLVNDVITALAAQPFQAFAGTVNGYALPNTTGQHQVYVQYQNATGDISTIYSTYIIVTP